MKTDSDTWETPAGSETISFKKKKQLEAFLNTLGWKRDKVNPTQGKVTYRKGGKYYLEITYIFKLPGWQCVTLVHKANDNAFMVMDSTTNPPLLADIIQCISEHA